MQSGYLAARLMSMGLVPGSEILVVNISRQISNHRHIIKRNKGFENFFNDHDALQTKINTLNIENTLQESVNHYLEN